MGALPYGVHESFHHVDPVPLVPPHIVVQAVIPDAHRSLSCRKLPTSELGLSVRWGHVIHVICVSPLALPLSSFFFVQYREVRTCPPPSCLLVKGSSDVYPLLLISLPQTWPAARCSEHLTSHEYSRRLPGPLPTPRLAVPNI